LGLNLITVQSRRLQVVVVDRRVRVVGLAVTMITRDHDKLVLLFSLIFFIVPIAECSHFRGAVIMVRPKPGGELMEVSHTCSLVHLTNFVVAY